MRFFSSKRNAMSWATLALLAFGCSARSRTQPVVDASNGGLGEPAIDGSPPVDSTDADAAEDGASPGDGGTSVADGSALGIGILVGYYAEWAKTTFPPSAVQWSALTHLAEAFALPSPDGGLANVADFADDALVQAAHAHGVKIVASIGGASGDFYGSVVGSAPRARTVAAVASLCADHGYDGVDIDWEFPDTGTISAWVALVSDLRAALDAVRPGLSLSSTIGPLSPQIDLPPLASLDQLDWVEVMTYPYSDPQSDEVGFLAPIAAVPDSGEGSVSSTIQYLIGVRGVSASKLLLGLPFYGFEFKDGPPGTPISSPSHVVELDDGVVLPMVGTAGWTRSWDPLANEPGLVNGKLFITYEDTASIDAKCALAHASGLGGAMVWHMGEGVLPDGSQPLLAHAAGCR
jgi:chitinase